SMRFLRCKFVVNISVKNTKRMLDKIICLYINVTFFLFNTKTDLKKFNFFNPYLIYNCNYT
ncbi:MAG: hypothetical protein JSV23_03410, partial [Promethearchaeota archaeon]